MIARRIRPAPDSWSEFCLIFRRIACHLFAYAPPAPAVNAVEMIRRAIPNVIPSRWRSSDRPTIPGRPVLILAPAPRKQAP